MKRKLLKVLLFPLVIIIGCSIITIIVVEPLSAGCHLNIIVKNIGEHKIRVSNSHNDTGVRARISTWRALNKGLWMYDIHNPKNKIFTVEPGKSKGSQYNAVAGCRVKRRYRIKYYCLGGNNKGQSFTQYYPSSSGFTTKSTFKILLSLCK